MLTRRQPVASAASSDSVSRMPPESSTCRSSRPTIEAMRSRLLPRPKAASRSTRWIHSAPCSCQRSAASHGSPNSPPLPATPWTSWTARPPAMSTAGSSSRRGWSVMSRALLGVGIWPLEYAVGPGHHGPAGPRRGARGRDVGTRLTRPPVDVLRSRPRRAAASGLWALDSTSPVECSLRARGRSGVVRSGVALSRRRGELGTVTPQDVAQPDDEDHDDEGDAHRPGQVEQGRHDECRRVPCPPSSAARAGCVRRRG